MKKKIYAYEKLVIEKMNLENMHQALVSDKIFSISIKGVIMEKYKNLNNG